jgi:hypothetical protein
VIIKFFFFNNSIPIISTSLIYFLLIKKKKLRVICGNSKDHTNTKNPLSNNIDKHKHIHVLKQLIDHPCMHARRNTHRDTGYKHATAKENHIEKFQTVVLLHRITTKKYLLV